MARDDDGRRKPKGTLALDISDMDLEGNDPPAKAARSRSEGRSSGRGRSGGALPLDDDPPARRGGGEGRGGGGGGGAKGTQALDISEMDLDDGYDGRSASRPGRSGAAWGGDDDGGSAPAHAARGGRQVDDWSDDDFDVGRADPRDEAPSRPTRPVRGISDQDLANATPPPPAAGEDATRAIGQFELPEAPSRPSARLTVRSGDTGQPIHTLDKDVIKVGREVDNDVVLMDLQSSRYHFELHRRGSSYELRDLDSGNGTHVNGHKISRVTLTEGAVVAVGDTEMVFDLVAPGGARPRGGLSSAPTEAATAPPAPDAPAAVPTEDASPQGAAAGDSGFPIPIGFVVGLGAVGLLGFVFLSLIVVFMATGGGDKPKKKGGAGGGGLAVADGDLDIEDDMPPDVMVGPALSRADKAFGAGDWLTARRHLLVAKSVAPGNKRIKEFLGRVDRALQTQDTPALRVTFEPERPKRGKPLAIRIRLEQPVQEIRATFMGERMVLKPSPSVPREYVAEMTVPKKVKKGEKELDVELTDLQDARFEFARRVAVR